MSPAAVVLVSAAVAGLLAAGLPAFLCRLPEPADPPATSYRELAGWPPLVPLAVSVSAGVAALLAWGVEPSRLMIALAPLVPVLVMLAYVDWRVQRLPKMPILAATTAGLVLAGAEWLWVRETEVLRAVVGLALARSVFWLLWRLAPRAMGFGDVRLAAVVGLVLGRLGWDALALGLWAGLVIFGVWGVARALARGSRSAMREPLAYGPFMIVGMLVGVLVVSR
ncbi:leader peptidase (prepilin peptidase)/N-methyltransferase [Nocardioides albertanoniae]|uniref:Leader peptidase (Prepilin peptidase)/N-methyltransferase n=1 Tax=Nocardioides albertanoniae TaxID=1175486 RepID=A0A543A6V7_9ACTN|nr:A24 family peptidase [Nocardioides albertanoniae]TQL68307.1 leader peptidase (prepilin peptidase)/N-methyltransferase [Nocardioides albertanoniae]